MDALTPAFIALRAATLGIDDLCRQRVRGWLVDAVDFRGVLAKGAAPRDQLIRLFAAAVDTLTEEERRAYRQWVVRWTDYSGRIITPGEHARGIREIADGVAPNSGNDPGRGRRPS